MATPRGRLDYRKHRAISMQIEQKGNDDDDGDDDENAVVVEFNGHRFVRQKNAKTRPIYCSFCKRSLQWSGKDSYRCRGCHLSVHARCHDQLLSACPAAKRATPGDASPKLARITLNVPHRFVKTTFRAPAFCRQCGRMITGFLKQGVRCSACGVACHFACCQKIAADCGLDQRQLVASLNEIFEQKSGDQKRNMSVPLIDDMAEAEFRSSAKTLEENDVVLKALRKRLIERKRRLEAEAKLGNDAEKEKGKNDGKTVNTGAVSAVSAGDNDSEEESIMVTTVTLRNSIPTRKQSSRREDGWKEASTRDSTLRTLDAVDDAPHDDGAFEDLDLLVQRVFGVESHPLNKLDILHAESFRRKAESVLDAVAKSFVEDRRRRHAYEILEKRDGRLEDALEALAALHRKPAETERMVRETESARATLAEMVEGAAVEARWWIEQLVDKMAALYEEAADEALRRDAEFLVEEVVLDRNWGAMLRVYRLAAADDDEKLKRVFSRGSNEAKIGVPLEFLPRDYVPLRRHRRTDPRRFSRKRRRHGYEDVVRILRRMVESESILEKLECVVEAAKSVCVCAARIQMARGVVEDEEEEEETGKTKDEIEARLSTGGALSWGETEDEKQKAKTIRSEKKEDADISLDNDNNKEDTDREKQKNTEKGVKIDVDDDDDDDDDESLRQSQQNEKQIDEQQKKAATTSTATTKTTTTTTAVVTTNTATKTTTKTATKTTTTTANNEQGFVDASTFFDVESSKIDASGRLKISAPIQLQPAPEPNFVATNPPADAADAASPDLVAAMALAMLKTRRFLVAAEIDAVSRVFYAPHRTAEEHCCIGMLQRARELLLGIEVEEGEEDQEEEEEEEEEEQLREEEEKRETNYEPPWHNRLDFLM